MPPYRDHTLTDLYAMRRKQMTSDKPPSLVEWLLLTALIAMPLLLTLWLIASRLPSS
jgi:hypothetical protein